MTFKLNEDNKNLGEPDFGAESSNVLDQEFKKENVEVAVIGDDFYYSDGEKLIKAPIRDYPDLKQLLKKQTRKQAGIEDTETGVDDDVEAAEMTGRSLIKKNYDNSVQREKETISKKLEKSKYKDTVTKLPTSDLHQLELDISQGFRNMLNVTEEEHTVRKTRKTMPPDAVVSDINNYEVIVAQNLKKREKEIKEVTKEVIFVYFYFDRSSSFHATYTSDGKLDKRHRDDEEYKKTVLGKRIQNLFKKINSEGVREKVTKDGYDDPNSRLILPPGSLEFQTVYFGNVVSDNPDAKVYGNYRAEEFCGGNEPDVLIEDIAERTKGKLCNVVVLTDSDNSSAQLNAKIDGNVWLLFANQWDKYLQSHIHGTCTNGMYMFKVSDGSSDDDKFDDVE